MQVVFDVSPRLLTLLTQFGNYGVQIMASLKEIQDELITIKTGVDTSNALVVDLKAQIAALKAQPGLVTQAQLDDLDRGLDGIIAAQGGGAVDPPPADQV